MELVVQLERALPDGSRYQRLGPKELGGYALALARCWRLAGLERGDRVMIMDFGCSPLSYLASSMYCPFLRRGAAEMVGCIPVCNDGVGTVIPRAIRMIEVLQPRVVYLRGDLVPPLLQALQETRLCVRTWVVGAEEAVPSAADLDRLAQASGGEVLGLVRLDAALFMAQQCSRCRAFHVWTDIYRVWEDRGCLATAPRFSPDRSYVSSLPLRIVKGMCRQGPRHIRLALLP